MIAQNSEVISVATENDCEIMPNMSCICVNFLRLALHTKERFRLNRFLSSLHYCHLIAILAKPRYTICFSDRCVCSTLQRYSTVSRNFIIVLLQ